MSITVGLMRPGIHTYLQHSDGTLLHYWAIQESEGMYLPHRIAGDSATAVTPAKQCFFYVDVSKQLVGVKLTWLEEREEWKYDRTVLVDEVLLVQPDCVELQQEITMYAIVKDGIVEMKTNDGSNILDSKIVYASKGNITSISAQKTGENIYVGFVEDGQIYYLSINENKISQIGSIQHQGKKKVLQLKLLSINNTLQVIFKDNDSEIHQIPLQPSGLSLPDNQRNYLTSNYCIKDNFLYFFSADQTISGFNLTNIASVQYQLEEQTAMKHSALSIIDTQWGTELFYFDPKQEVVHCRLINNIFKRVQPYPTLNWQLIKENCQPIGDPGYHADAYYYETQQIVLKRMREPRPYRVLKEIKTLEKISPIYPGISRYQLIENGTLVGQSLKYLPGEKWDTILKRQHCIFRENPVFRVKLVRQLARIIRELQLLRVCHGDFHLGNVLIDLDSDKELRVWLIDFGNAFAFEEGKLVSEGLNGWTLLIPIEAESKRKKNYDPSGVNAFQLGRVILQILLLESHQDYQRLQVSPEKELLQLSQSKQYPPSTCCFVRNLLDDSITVRNQTLLGLNLEGLQYEVQQIYLQKLEKLQ